MSGLGNTTRDAGTTCPNDLSPCSLVNRYHLVNFSRLACGRPGLRSLQRRKVDMLTSHLGPQRCTEERKLPRPHCMTLVLLQQAQGARTQQRSGPPEAEGCNPIHSSQW